MEAVMRLENEFPVFGFIGIITGKPTAKSYTWQSDFIEIDPIVIQIEINVLEHFRFPLLRRLNDISIEISLFKNLLKNESVSVPCIILSSSFSRPQVVGQKDFKQGKVHSTESRLYDQESKHKDLQVFLASTELDIQKLFELVKKLKIGSSSKKLKTYWKMELKRLF